MYNKNIQKYKKNFFQRVFKNISNILFTYLPKTVYTIMLKPNFKWYAEAKIK